MNLKKNISDKYMLPLFAIAIGVAYYGLWNTFFFADAWQLLDSYPLQKNFGLSYIFQLFPMPYGFHFIPLSMLITTAEAYFFGVHVLGYVIVSLILHFF